MKKRSIYLAAIVLALLTLTACVKYEFSGAVDPAGKMFTITAANASIIAVIFSMASAALSAAPVNALRNGAYFRGFSQI